jgi:hypothetical protein
MEWLSSPRPIGYIDTASAARKNHRHVRDQRRAQGACRNLRKVGEGAKPNLFVELREMPFGLYGKLTDRYGKVSSGVVARISEMPLAGTDSPEFERGCSNAGVTQRCFRGNQPPITLPQSESAREANFGVALADDEINVTNGVPPQYQPLKSEA